MNTKGIKAILFDSGKVLNSPKTGHWFITPHFNKYVNKDVFDKQDPITVNKAFRKAYDYLCSNLLIETKEEEYKLFYQYYRIIAEELPKLKLNREIIAELTKDLVYNDDKYVFYEDVYQVIPRLSESYALGIISDAWPSLIDVYEKANLKDYFHTFVISSILGVSKPNPIMYMTALEALGIEPHEAIFIDDCPDNCRGAKRLGIEALLLSRDKEAMLNHDFRVITDLYQLIKILEVGENSIG